MIITPHRNSRSKKTGITFPKLESWNPMTNVATIAADVDKQRVLCRISLKVLQKKFNASSDNPMKSVVEHRSRLQECAKVLIEEEKFEEDGSILIRMHDI